MGLQAGDSTPRDCPPWGLVRPPHQVPCQPRLTFARFDALVKLANLALELLGVGIGSLAIDRPEKFVVSVNCPPAYAI